MNRSFWTLLLVMAGGPAAAQEPVIPVHKLTVTPAAAPVPALRYELLPELRDTTPGNAALLYYRAFSPDLSSVIRGNKALQEKIEAALDKPAAEVKATGDLEFIRDWTMLKEVDRAARRAYCDWEMTPRLREEGISFLLPEIQGLREFARYLKIRAKLELADRQFDKAAYTLQTELQLGRHTAEAPTLIQALVGSAITQIGLREVEEWIGTPDSPNLFWALGLPQPYIDLRKPLQGERMMIDSLLPGYREALADPAKIPPPLDEELRRKLGEVMGNRRGAATAFLMALSFKNYPAAKQYLLEHGRTAEQVDALPAISAVLLHQVALYDRPYDDMLKLWGLPYWVARPLLQRADQALKQEVRRAGMPGLSLAGLLMPAIQKVFYGSARTDRKINLLRTIEALRMYAADHGHWPEKLSDITEVPVPIDPITGNSFEYTPYGVMAAVTAPPPAGERADPGNSERYEITLKK